MFHCNECDGQFAHKPNCSILAGERERLRNKIANWVHPLDAYRAQIEREVRTKCADEIEAEVSTWQVMNGAVYDSGDVCGLARLIRPKE